VTRVAIVGGGLGGLAADPLAANAWIYAHDPLCPH
jgi:uncharacterized protein with NAD-binding domain and iron-sulfur cluster